MEPEENDEDPMEMLLKKHKKEKKELQSRIQSLKKSATKGDKKKKKEVQEEIAKLEQELSMKHEKEVKQLKEVPDKNMENSAVDKIASIEISDEKPVFKVTKAQKRRDKKAAELKERERRILEQEVENKTGSRSMEIAKIKQELKKRGFMIHEIEADGNCLYNAIDHQLKVKTNSNLGVKKLRLETSKHIRENPSEYLPFLSNAITGDPMSHEDFVEYCNNIANTTNWGGQVELKALSQVIKKPITVIQADGPPLIMGEEYMNTSESLFVSYHRHMYKLGEHYNSVQPYAEDDS